MKENYKKRLRHIQPKGLAFFVTFRLYGSIPKIEMDQLKNGYKDGISEIERQNFDKKKQNILKFNLRKEYLEEYDSLLHQIKCGPTYFKDIKIIEILKKQLHRFDGDLYELVAYSIMSNHVHILIDTGIQLDEDKEDDNNMIKKYVYLDQIMKKIKGPSAVYCNRALGINGQFRERESYDIYIRNEKMFNSVIAYILNNPVKSGLVSDWRKYAGNYINSQWPSQIYLSNIYE